MNIKVAVRVRPFNAREKELSSDCCVRMSDKTTEIFDTDGSVLHSFTFDHSFWSHDGFKTGSNGVLVKDSIASKYVDQKKVYETLGKEIVRDSFDGYNCCLFAYG
jgi:hypothetical protein